MGKFIVHIFLTHSFIPSPIRVDNIFIEPFRGTGVSDIADLIDDFLVNELRQPPQPTEQRQTMSDKIREDGSSAILTIEGIEATNHIEAIMSTEETLLLSRDILALRQLQRGLIAGFISIQTDVSPVSLYSQIRRPYPILRKVRNMPFESESEIFSRLIQKAKGHSLLQVYLSLYADTLAYSDTLVTDVSLETRLIKTWSLLEAMALSESGFKKQKVKSLLKRYGIPMFPNYHDHLGQDLIDLAYKWRNVIAHCGGCKSATASKDKAFCQNFSTEFADILEDLSEVSRMLLHSYANSISSRFE
jgi:hypothetical protein